ncbi:MAG: hypothetical protein NVS1B4_05950 [Gemmatimonadaceae bacterium]
MLSFDLRDLDPRALAVDGELDPDDGVWQAGDPRPLGCIRVVGRLSTAGPGQIYWHGHLKGLMAAQCRRCLEQVKLVVEDEMQAVFAEPDAEGSEDPDVYPLDSDAINLDLRPVIREHWLLGAPSYALCREDCQGICPACGSDRNAVPCHCTSANPDDRWAVLNQVRDLKP